VLLLGGSSQPIVRPTARLAGAAWTTIILHVGIAVVLTLRVPRAGPEDGAARPAEPIRTDLVWLKRPGPPTGGGLDGDGQPGRRAAAQRPGSSRMTVPVRRPPSFAGVEHPKPPLQEINLPAVPEASGLREVPGVVSPVVFSDYTTSHGPRAGPGSGDGDGDGLGKGRRGNTGDGPAGTGTGVQPPELIVQVRPEYTSAAMLARIQGVVSLEAIVMADGSVGDVRIIGSLDRDLGLDEQAIKAVKRWRFRPATRLGAAIPMFVSIEMTFSLR
jgi:periplasmic protein TonB